MKKTQVKNSMLLLLTAFIWGTAFVAQSVGMDYVEAFTFTCIRNLIGGAVLILFLCWTKKGKIKVTKIELIGGICCGLALCAASNAQQLGIIHTTVSKAGFITALYVVIVPIMGVFMKKKVPGSIWICVVLSVIGLYLLCMTGESFSIGYGDFLTLICAVLFSVHIMIIDHFSPKGDGVVISCIQFFVCGLVSGIFMFLFETPNMSNILQAKGSILYAGVLSSGVAYTLQVVAQKDVNPTVASLILCLESVISAIAGWILLDQTLTPTELVGCAMMFGAIVLAQVPMPVRRKESI